MKYTFIGLLIVVGLLVFDPGVAPFDIRFKLLVLFTSCLLTQFISEFWSLP